MLCYGELRCDDVKHGVTHPMTHAIARQTIHPLSQSIYRAEPQELTSSRSTATLQHIILHHITSHHVISYHITPHHTTPHHITSHHISSRHITSHYITPHLITSHHITSHHITSHHITSHHITSKLDTSTCILKLQHRRHQHLLTCPRHDQMVWSHSDVSSALCY